MMAARRLTALCSLLLALTLGAASAMAEPSFAIIFNNTKNDGGFNESALKGLERFKAETGADARENVIRSEEESIRAMRTFAERGVTDILLIGFINEPAVKTVATEFPKTHFTLIDGMVDLPNVRSVLFREDEAGYLAGVAAGHATRSGVVGFVGGMAIPPVRRFECGYIQGVLSVAPQARIVRRYMGDQPTVFRDKALGERTAAAVLAEGADIVFAAAGYGGNGALEATAKAGKLGIGVDTNQNGMAPGRILTSAVKRVDVAAYTALKDALAGTWTGGVQRLGLARNGVDWVRDSNNETLVQGFADKVDAAAKAIASAAVTVEDVDTAAVCR